ncbi:MAG: glycoside hydrolase family 3 N-terminal domain-containing protein [Planctomycetota bacterium]
MSTTDTQLSPPTSLREKLAQLMVVRIGSNLPPVRTVEQDAERIDQLLTECPVGGLIVFNGKRDQTPATLAELQARCDVPLLVSADIERGVGQQLHGPELFPHAMAFDALGDQAVEAVEEFARLTAIDARASGIHIAFAPVADVNVDPRNPIIATRAFGSDPERVAELVTAFVRGCAAGGLLSTVKHFPGHGNTHEDSHHALPTIVGDLQQLESCELVPFRAAIDAGVPLVMSAHVRYPAWDDTGAPATLSSSILIDLLREQIGFSGAVVSDSLLMEGVKSRFNSEGELAVNAMLSGVDILLDVAEPSATLIALEKAVDAGDLPEQRVDEAFARLWQLKRQIYENDADPGRVAEQITSLVDQTAERAIRVVSGANGFSGFDTSQSLSVVLVRPYQSHLDPPEQPLGEAIRERAPGADYFELGPLNEEQDYQRVLEQVAHVEQLLVAIIVKPAAWHAFGLLPQQQTFVEHLIGQQPCLLASLGTPEALEKFADATFKICTYSDVPASQCALAKFVLQLPE